MTKIYSLVLFGLFFFSAVAQEGRPSILKLEAGNIPRVKAVENNLPLGAVAHIQANNLEKIIFDFEELALNFLPEETLPEAMQPILQDPHPLLAFLGMQMNIPNIKMELLAQMTGLQFNQALTLSLYIEKKPELLLTLPAAKLELMSDTLIKALSLSSGEKVKIGSFDGYKVKSRNRKLPKRTMYIVCSEDRVYVSSSSTLLEKLAPAADQSLAKDKAIAASLKQYANTDVVMTLSPLMIKPQLNMLAQQFSTFSQEQIDHFKSRFLRKIDREMPGVIDSINVRLKWDFGIRDLNQLLDYLECYGIPAYEVVFEELHNCLKNFNGLTLAADLDGRFQKLLWSVYSDNIDPNQNTRPIPMASAKKALDQLPANRSWTHITGQQPKSQACAVSEKWLSLVEARFDKKKLPKTFFEGIKKYIQSQGTLDSFESRAAWTLSTQISGEDYFDTSNSETIMDFFSSFYQKMVSPRSFGLTLSPAPEGVFAKYLNDKKNHILKAKTSNTAFSKLLSGGQESWIHKDVRLFKTAKNDTVNRWAFEEAFLTASGFFGYDQHEFINRDVYYTSQLGEYLAIEKTASDAPWVTGEKKPSPASKAMVKLLTQAPENCYDIFVFDGRSFVLSIADFVTATENMIHKELGNYLTEVTDAAKADGDIDAVEMPLYVQSLNRSEETGEYYLALPGDLVFPRPKVSKIVNDMLSDYASLDNTLGGSIIYQKHHKGRTEAGLVISTEAMAYLVKSTVNKFHSTYIQDPQGLEKLMTSITSQRDNQPDNYDEVVLNNPSMKAVFGKIR